ncbi:hypothetical protein GCM10029992_53170 [Glycomyces albus]
MHEAFGHTHREISGILEITENGSQQLLSRARRHVAGGRIRAEVDRDAARELVEEFLAAAATGEIEALVKLLAEDSMGIGDGGGRIPARKRPVLGATAVAKFLRGLFKPSEAKREMIGGSPDVYPGTANGSPALLVVVDDRVVSVMALEVVEGRIAAVLNQANPDKLARATKQWAADGPHGEPLLSRW